MYRFRLETALYSGITAAGFCELSQDLWIDCKDLIKLKMDPQARTAEANARSAEANARSAEANSGARIREAEETTKTKTMEENTKTKQIEAERIAKIKKIEADHDIDVKKIEADKEIKIIEQQKKAEVETMIRKLELEQQHELAVASASSSQGSTGGDRSLPARDVSRYREKMSAFMTAKPENTKYNGKLLRMCYHCRSPRAFFSSCRVMLDKSSSVHRVICAGCSDVFSREIRKKQNWRQLYHFLPNPTKNLLRDAVWVRSNGLEIKGKCDACNFLLDFGSYHRAHDLARALGGGDEVENSFVSCAQCNMGSGVTSFCRVITATRERLGLPSPSDRPCSKMVVQGVLWMSRTKVTAAQAMKCPWEISIFPTDMRSYTFSSIRQMTVSF